MENLIKIKNLIIDPTKITNFSLCWVRFNYGRCYYLCLILRPYGKELTNYNSIGFDDVSLFEDWKRMNKPTIIYNEEVRKLEIKEREKEIRKLYHSVFDKLKEKQKELFKDAEELKL